MMDFEELDKMRSLMPAGSLLPTIRILPGVANHESAAHPPLVFLYSGRGFMTDN